MITGELTLFEVHAVNEHAFRSHALRPEIADQIRQSKAARDSGTAYQLCHQEGTGSSSSLASSDSSGYETEAHPSHAIRESSTACGLEFKECVKQFLRMKLPTSYKYPTGHLALQTIATPANISALSNKLVLHTADGAHLSFHQPGVTANRNISDKLLEKILKALQVL